MERVFGRLPGTETVIEKHYRDKDGNKIKIEAGECGWTVILGDGSILFGDVDNTPEANFKAAGRAFSEHLGGEKICLEHVATINDLQV